MTQWDRRFVGAMFPQAAPSFAGRRAELDRILAHPDRDTPSFIDGVGGISAEVRDNEAVQEATVFPVSPFVQGSGCMVITGGDGPHRRRGTRIAGRFAALLVDFQPFCPQSSARDLLSRQPSCRSAR